MRNAPLLSFCVTCLISRAQQLQLHYDLRHSVDPDRNRRNFASLTYEHFNDYYLTNILGMGRLMRSSGGVPGLVRA